MPPAPPSAGGADSPRHSRSYDENLQKAQSSRLLSVSSERTPRRGSSPLASQTSFASNSSDPGTPPTDERIVTRRASDTTRRQSLLFPESQKRRPKSANNSGIVGPSSPSQSSPAESKYLTPESRRMSSTSTGSLDTPMASEACINVSRESFDVPLKIEQDLACKVPPPPDRVMSPTFSDELLDSVTPLINIPDSFTLPHHSTSSRSKNMNQSEIEQALLEKLMTLQQDLADSQLSPVSSAINLSAVPPKQDILEVHRSLSMRLQQAQRFKANLKKVAPEDAGTTAPVEGKVPPQEAGHYGCWAWCTLWRKRRKVGIVDRVTRTED
ncbi:uncharacterized protein BJ171DRAFT_595715 [Polychytrium aggregatum]|uniref:uncharacterized protein n=1 Tax=Polychytrium aggregatum TaxID=110093 RepID=UPI0022FED979|nr:uncharacterized protein BJ171DRAFT_595715 [Polychytrium aggregatum]KAI9208584.1 hypothetical protein BJ171DRAFT_595715 [Polychytrium aggregatum]